MLFLNNFVYVCLTMTYVSAIPVDRRFGALDLTLSARSDSDVRAMARLVHHTVRNNDVRGMMEANNTENSMGYDVMPTSDDDSTNSTDDASDETTPDSMDGEGDSTEDSSSGQEAPAPPPPSTECVLNKLIVASGTTETKLTLRDLVPLVQSDKAARANVQDALDNIGIAGETLADLAEVVASGQAVPQDKLDTLVAAFNATGAAIDAMSSDENSVARIMKQAKGEFLQVQQGSDGVLKTCG